jgi:hypothetical protein
MVGKVKDNKAKVKRRESRLKKDVHLIIEKKKKMEMETTCLQLIAKVNKEATLEVVQVLNIKIRCQINNSSNNTCPNSLILQISTHLLKDNKIKILDKTVFHLVTMALETSNLHRFIS